MVSLKGLLDGILSDITPTRKEHEKEKEALSDIFEILNAVINRINPKVEAILVGSIAKGTDLRGDKDFDIFISFPNSVARGDLEEQGLEIGRGFFELVGSKPVLNYAEHPYVKGDFHGYEVEIVPCYKIEKDSELLSAVDRTPLHTDFVLSKIKKDASIPSEVRLLKRFMKANGIYGAHAAVEGFSGYLCELLVIKYGSFLRVLEAAASWHRDEYLELEEKGKKNFSESPLVFIDPVDENRNVAAAVSTEKLARMVFLSREFLRYPDAGFFYGKKEVPMSKKEFYKLLHKRGTELICVNFLAPELIEDTLIPQIAKSLRILSAECEHRGFRILKKGHHTDGKEVMLLLEFEVSTLPKVEKKLGPFFDSAEKDFHGFLLANKKKAASKAYLEGDRWAIDVERETVHAHKVVRDYLRSPEGFGKNLRGVSARVLANSEIRKIENPSFWQYMGSFW